MKRLIMIIGVIFFLLVNIVFAKEVDTKIKVIPTLNGDEASVLVKYTDNTDMFGGSLNFVYDNEKLEIIDVSEGDAIKNTTHFINDNYATNAIRVNWVCTSKMSSEGDLLIINFKLLDDSFDKYDISVDSLKVADGDGNKLVADYEVVYEEEDSSPSNNTTTGNNHSSNRKPSVGIVTIDKEKQDVDKSSQFLFEDVNKDEWFYESVKYVFDNNLMNGISETEFAPQNTVTRAMLVTVLYRLEKEPRTDDNMSFVDVSSDTYYANAVSWAKNNNIVSGISETEFYPDINITREQIATIMYRYAMYKGYDVSIGRKANVLQYTDFINISEYAISPMQYAIVTGILKGKTETTLNPSDNATRAEIATILKRFIKDNK